MYLKGTGTQKHECPVYCETKKSLCQPPTSSFTVLKSCCHETNVARFFFFFACIWRPKFSNDRFLMVTLQKAHNMCVQKQITEQYLLGEAKYEAQRSLECLSMNNCLTNALQHVHDVILNQRYPALYSSTSPQSPKHYFDFFFIIIYCILHLDKTEKAFSHSLS